MSNVYLKDMPLAGHLYRVTMQKRAPNSEAKNRENLKKIMCFPIKKRQKQHTLKRKIVICCVEVVLS